MEQDAAVVLGRIILFYQLDTNRMIMIGHITIIIHISKLNYQKA